ncbi:MAG: nucleotidyltransferase domain-containing protein [Planctomycetota bacterium]
MVANEEIKGMIQRLAAKIRDEYRPERIILYGSFAYGRPAEGSDIDLLIVKKTDERPLDRRVRVRRIADIRDPACPPFSPVVLTPREVEERMAMGDQIIEDILARGEVLYAA